ncbi:glycosyltransferase [Geobacillus stearothermophilus]|uniref:glycosyltransferase n=1 Tax=Geobacillus stearothermophilus TaxID=1422 RepID=UPI003D227029
MNKHIAIFLPSLHGGGAERVMLNLAHGLYEEGYRVDIILSKAEGSYLKQLSKDINLLDLNCKRVLHSLVPLMKYLKNNRPPILLSALGHANLVALWAVELAKTSTKVIVTEHSTLSISIKNSKNLKSKFIPFLMKKFYRKALSIVTVSKGVAEDLIKNLNIPKEKVKVIYNPIVTEKLIALSYEDVEHPWMKNNERPIILAAGRLTAAKDYPTMIKSFRKIRNKINAKLIILGEGEQRKKIEELAENLGIRCDIDIVGFVENPYAYMRKADIFLLTSKWEGFGNVLVEAMACGTPVVATDCPNGPREILEDGKYGVLVPPGNVDALTEAVLNHFLQPSNINKEKLLSRANDFHIKKIVKQYLALFKE